MNGENGLGRMLAWRRRWPDARHALRRLPMIESGPERIEAILAMTTEGPGLDDDAAGGDGRAELRRTRSRRVGAFAALAAAVAITTVGVWTASSPALEPEPTELELARLDAEVEMVLARLGRFMQRTEHIALDDLLKSNATTNQ